MRQKEEICKISLLVIIYIPFPLNRHNFLLYYKMITWKVFVAIIIIILKHVFVNSISNGISFGTHYKSKIWY